ncbi:MAG TPA: GAF domain-containing protein, partial [Burkholderiaceae bacterium]
MTARRWRLFPKYALLIIALVGGMLLAASAVSLYFSWRETRQHLVALQVEKAEGAATRIEQYVQGIEQQLGWTALPTLDAVGNPIEGRRIEYLKLLRQVPAITEVAWIDPAGREQLRVSRLAMDTVSAGTDVSKQPRFLAASTGKTWYSPVYFRKDTEPYLTIARPAGGAGGVTAAEVNLKFVWEVVSRIRVGQKGLAYVVDDAGILIAHPDISLVLKKIDMRALPQVAALAADAAPDARDLGGQPVFSAHAPIRTLGWQVFVESPRAEALAPLYASVERLGLLLAAGLALSMVASFFLARALVRPIRTIQEGAVRLGAGELQRRIDVKTGDELEGLAEQFNRMGEQLRESYADLERKVEQRTAELSESLEHQTAISEVLRVISQSPTDVAPVFEAILDSATRLFGSPLTAIFRYDGKLVQLVGVRNWPAQAIEDARRFYPGPPDTRMMSGRVILSGAVQVEEDTFRDPAYDQTAAHLGTWRRMLGAPLLKDGATVGAIVLAWPRPGETPRRQIDLLQTFADQAVIAIENVRLIHETREALEQQTASAEVLRVISQSPTDVQPVFDAIAERAMTLCGAMIGAVARFDGERVHLVAFRGTSPEAAATMRAAYPMPLGRRATLVRAVQDRVPVQIADVLEDADYGLQTAATRAGYRANLAVPMLREGHVVGAIGVCRAQPGLFPDKLVRLLQSFADQAVIAIENVRLFNETKEALERQTATAEVLRVISESPTDVQPVLDAVAARSAQLCRAEGSRIWLPDGDALCAMTGYRGADGAERGRGERLPARATSTVGHAFVEGRVVHVDDIEPLVDDRYPDSRALQGRHGFRTVLAVPMLREGAAVGVIGLLRKQVRPFSPAEIALVRTFADQAVIAIENVRLFNETREALEQQTATAQILQVISNSVADTSPVFGAILASCERLFGGLHTAINLVGDDGRVHLAAHRGPAPNREAFERSFPVPLSRESGSGMAILERRVMHYPDVEEGTDVPPYVRRSARTIGTRSLILAPLLWEGRGIGVITVGRASPGAFSDKEITLLRTFADQAVIAIQNARLFDEIQAKSRELEQANKHKSEFLANMSHELRTPLNAIIGFSEVLAEQMFGEVNDKQLEYLRDIHSSGQHLLSLINDILDLSKIEAGRMELDLSTFDLGLLLDNSMTLVRERATRHGLTLALDVGEGIDDWVADQRKIKQVVINLLSNAVKFTPAGGRVTLRARRL